MKNLGIESFTEVCNEFQHFAITSPIATRVCKTLLTGSPNPQMNYIYNVDLTNLSALADDLATLRATKIPMMFLVTAEEAEPLQKFMTENGLAYYGSAQAKSMSLDNFNYTPNPEVRVEKVTPKTLSAWRELAAEGFAYSTEDDKKMFENFFKYGEPKTVQLFLGYLGNKPAGQSMLVLGDELASNMWSSVLPEYRRRGVLTEMICYRMKLAKEAGYKITVVQCFPMSAGVYDKVGFKNNELINLYALNKG